MVSFSEYYRMLDNHDWQYHMTDSYKVFQDGQNEREKLISLSNTSPEFEQLYRDFHYYKYSGKCKPELK